MQDVFSNAKFWELFYRMEIELEEVEYDSILSQLKEAFKYREDMITYEYEGKEKTSIDKVIEFEFSCGISFSLRLDLFLEHRSGNWANTETNLYLLDKKDGKVHQMGWWDLARWHPLCLKREEFELLLEYWNLNDPIWKNTPFPKLLLKNYVGFQEETSLESFKEETLMEFRSLLLDDFEMVQETLSSMFFCEDYEWKKHESLGWVFESEVYNCYSIRNECHASGEEGLFPFKEYQEMIEDVKALML